MSAHRPPGLTADEALRWHGWTVTPSGCWEWASGVNRHGYGRIGMGRKVWLAHRLAYETWAGPIGDGQEVRHVVCDNPPCINPAHLAVGTHLDNMHDAVKRGRLPRGERHGNARLNADKIRAIRVARGRGESLRSIAEEFGVDTSTVCAITNGRRWGHVA